MTHLSASLRASALAVAVTMALALPACAHAGGDSRSSRRARAAALRDACHDDFTRLCDGVQPGGGRVAACLREHAPDLSPTCHQALTDARLLDDAGAAGGSGAAR